MMALPVRYEHALETIVRLRCFRGCQASFQNTVDVSWYISEKVVVRPMRELDASLTFIVSNRSVIGFFMLLIARLS